MRAGWLIDLCSACWSVRWNVGHADLCGVCCTVGRIRADALGDRGTKQGAFAEGREAENFSKLCSTQSIVCARVLCL